MKLGTILFLGLSAVMILWCHLMLRRRIDWVRAALYLAALGMLSGLADFGRLPNWLSLILSLAVIGFYWVSLNDDDDHRGGRKRRRGQALKRTKEWLARGIPARRPEAALQ